MSSDIFNNIEFIHEGLRVYMLKISEESDSLIKKIREVNPGIHFIFVSGYENEEMKRRTREISGSIQSNAVNAQTADDAAQKAVKNLEQINTGMQNAIIAMRGIERGSKQINEAVERINWKYSEDDWSPIVLTRNLLEYKDIIALYRMARVCFVNPLHDGMNLVAKEFLSSRSDEKGVLILSQFTGAARELSEAVFINPYDPEQFSEGIYKAIKLTDREKSTKMLKLRQVVQRNNIFRWAGKALSELLRFEFRE